MTKLLSSFLLLSAFCTAATCNLQGAFTVAGSRTVIDNRITQCSAYNFSYYANGFTGIQIEVDGAPDNNGTAGTWTAYTPDNTFLNPASATNFSMASFTNRFTPWVSISMPSITGTGSAVWTIVGSSNVTEVGGNLAYLANTANNGVGIQVTDITNNNPAAATGVSPIAALTVANVKTSAGNVYGFSCNNPNASTTYLQLYNTTGTPTLGTGVLAFFAMPASTTLNMIGASPLSGHSNGIGVGASTTATGAGTPAAAPACTILFK